MISIREGINKDESVYISTRNFPFILDRFLHDIYFTTK